MRRVHRVMVISVSVLSLNTGIANFAGVAAAMVLKVVLGPKPVRVQYWKRRSVSPQDSTLI